MPFRDLWTRRADIEVMAISGVLRVEIRLRQTIPPVVFELAGYAFFLWLTIQDWTRIDLLHKFIDGWVLLSAGMGLLYLLTGYEVLEFGQHQFTIRRNIFGWDYVSRYAVKDCSELTWCTTEHEDGKFGLECKTRWRKIRFAGGLSEEQAREILAKLQETLPEVAQKMGCTIGDMPQHLITLGLS